jgi:putative ABC transport system permease protein
MNFFAEIYEGFKISWGAIRANKLRSVLTTLGIVIGIVSVTLMGTAITGLHESFMRTVSSFGTDVIYISKFAWGFSDSPWWVYRNRRDITLADARRIEEEATTALAVSAESETMLNVHYESKSAAGVWVRGNTEKAMLVGGFNLSAGRFLSEQDVLGARPVCVIGASVATNFFANTPPLGKKLKISHVTYEVIGVMDKMGEFFMGFNIDNQIILPLARFISDFQNTPDVSIQVKVRDRSKIPDAMEELRGLMRKVRKLSPGDPDDFALNQQETFINTFRQVGGTIAAVGLFITGLSLFVGGIGIMNIMFVSVAERTREIGIRKAIGARRRTILIQFLIEAASICLLGGLIGLAIAYPITWGLSFLFPAELSPVVVGIALLVSLITGVVSGFFPAYRAARMSPVDALRSE